MSELDVLSEMLCKHNSDCDNTFMLTVFLNLMFEKVGLLNLLALNFKWHQSTFTYDILFTRHLNFSTFYKKR